MDKVMSKKSYEQNVSEIASCIEELEKNTLDLEESVVMYEHASKLLLEAQTQLKNAEKKVFLVAEKNLIPFETTLLDTENEDQK